eukprot:CAMPEP_0182447304 /NCGR_PEP_ID=MMETSP1172-20130603/14383_1 /TAXON_ID=708627 /ORGANISM="Timspurckia oligopyrenoides, Strain CCMP3278" /LENGTH=201 /DNA_ID=CAMNT_0024643695 /DNA_START=8 /DNA_END=610 /DNA_ORIENTATION=+
MTICFIGLGSVAGSGFSVGLESTSRSELQCGVIIDSAGWSVVKRHRVYWMERTRLQRVILSGSGVNESVSVAQDQHEDAPEWKHKDVDVEVILEKLNFNKDGLIAAMAQQYNTGEVLMQAWMNADAVRETLKTGRVCYYSRSRQALWRKGESSGQIQSLVDFTFDCDADAVLLQVNQLGVACHTGRRTCFYNAVRSDGIHV